MLHTDEDALICDFAETYHIYDWRSAPFPLVATLAAGLREDSRSKLLLAGQKVSFETQLAAGIYDKLAFLAWTKTKDAQNGRNCPEPIAVMLAKQTKHEKDKPMAYRDPESFKKAYKNLRRLALEHKGGANDGD